ncbi:hypothetical protein [Gulosibacter hominis]|uniref:hypothetical protein n=1 Tax=Gulosibacter hominis TaxID=2770504 RepID=UPI001918F57A|nr:hypothetical protein [Gulosibacter hominis]
MMRGNARRMMQRPLRMRGCAALVRMRASVAGTAPDAADAARELRGSPGARAQPTY